GMRIKNNMLSFEPKIPKQWNSYSFKVNFRNTIVKINVQQNGTHFTVDGNEEVTILVNEKPIRVTPNNLVTV
ncbi:MAG: hypothetical protein NWQ17_04435, partial [Polaribacter sp.]|nr:hypothetical protein [Polaribacter sp.]